MAGAPSRWLAVTPPVGPVYSLVLLAHVAAAVVGFGSVGITGLMAVRARRGPQSPDAETVRRFFRAPVNWPSRSIYLVPALGVALLALSRGTFDVGDHFVIVGLTVWVVSVVVAETVVWPAERRVVAAVRSWGVAGGEASLDPLLAAAAGGSAGSSAAGPAADRSAADRSAADRSAADRSAVDRSAADRSAAGPAVGRSAVDMSAAGRQAADRQAFERDCRLLERGAVLLVVLFIGTSWAMIVKP